jgi:hypothetical protein
MRPEFIDEITFLVFAASLAAGKTFSLQFSPANGFKHRLVWGRSK